MARSWPVRLQAFLLALLMLGGGGRLPVVDAVAFHRQPGSIPSGAALLAEDAVAPHGAADHLAAGFPLVSCLRPKARCTPRRLPTAAKPSRPTTHLARTVPTPSPGLALLPSAPDSQLS